MWDVPVAELKKRGIDLPPGYLAREEEDFFCLFFGEEEVARFSSLYRNLKEGIEKAIEDHQRKLHSSV
jgi:hypothetical protein